MAVAWALAPTLASAQVAGAPFTCDVVFYQIRNNAGNSIVIKFPSVNATSTPTSVYSALQTVQINAVGYNPVDNYMYGIQAAAGAPALYRIGQTGYELVGTISNSVITGTSLAAFTPTGGVFDAAGRYYFAGQSTNIVPASVFRVDFIPPITGTPQVSHQYNLTPSAVVNFGDFDFNGAGGPDGLLLGSVNNSHFRIQLQQGTTPITGTATVSTLPLATSVGGIGSAFYDAFVGKFYVFNNTTNTFWEIVNPQTGSPSAVATSAVTYSGTPNVAPPPFSSTDGTSCPISGSRVADLQVTKTDGVNSLPVGAATAYTITVYNAGPYPANYTVVSDPAAAGLSKTSVTCTAPGGPPSAVCPATLSVASLQSGVTVQTFPPGTTLVFTVNAAVTGAAGTTVTNTVTVTPAIDTTDPNLANNTAIDADAVVGSTTSVITGASICPSGTAESFVNRVANSDFSLGAPFSTNATLGANNTYQAANSVTRQSGAFSPGLGIQQQPFPGDSSRSVPGGPNWLFSNAGASTPVTLWYQPLTGLTVGRVYQFMAYVSNATIPGSGSATVPNLRMSVNTGGGTTTIAGVSATVALANEPAGPAGDVWRLMQGTFTATVSAVTVSIADIAAVSAEPGGGDVAGIAQATVRECAPAVNLSITKVGSATALVSAGTASYTVTVVNISTVAAPTSTIVDPAASGIIKATISCVATGGTTACPAVLNIPTFETTGLLIPQISPAGTVTFRITVTVSASPDTTVTNAVTVSGVSYVDVDPSNNSAQASNNVRGSANLSVTKSHVVGTKVAGGTTSYNITVSNAGPSSVVNLVLKDPAAPGLACTAVTCTGFVGGATCPAPAGVTIANLQGAGIVLPNMTVPSSIIFKVDCGITATGL